MDRGLLDTEADLVLRRVRTDNDGVVVEGEGGAPGAHCPHCGAWSETVHGRYCRQVRELPWGGRPVRLVLTVRTFCCLNLDCPRRTFAESFEPLVARQQQRTESVTELLLDYVEAAGGERGAKLAQHAGIPTSPDTLLRLQREQPAPVRPTPRVLGVDDLALRRGRRYATLLLDLETHEPVDLLPGRSATDFADWLRQHEGVQIIVRDRGGEYADGGRQGAPQARQIADKYHLLANATNAMDETLRGRPLTPAPEGGPDRIAPQDAVAPKAEQEAEAPPDELAATAPVAVLPHSAVEGSEVAPSPRALRWRERWEQARALRASGRRISQIARELRLSRPTIRKLLAVPAPPWQESPQGAGPLVSSELRPFLPYLQRRWAEGATMSALLRELHARGYHGSWSTLWRALHTWPRAKPTTKGSPPTPAATIRLSRRDRRWLLLRSPEKLTAAEKAVVERLLAADPALATAHRLLQEFRSVSRGGSIPDLDHWLDDAEQSGLPAFVSLAHGIQADREAVEGALTTHWTAGPTEGRICRIKLQKRLGYGRAAFDLLRTRVLVA